MRIRLGLPESSLDDREKKQVLDAALEAVTRAAEPLIARGKVPTAAAAIKSGRVVWRPEPPGDEHFDLPHTVLARGWGDCDDLAPWHAASLRASGTDPRARAIVKKSGPKRWHAVVVRGNGSVEDPSRAAGMGRNGVVGGEESVVGAHMPATLPMFPAARTATAVYPLARRGWASRCDIKDQRFPWHWTAMSMGLHPARAAARAIKTARDVAGEGYISEDTDLLLAGMHDLLCGADPAEVAACLEHMGLDFDVPEDVGFFGGILKAAGSLAKAASPIASFVPGGSLITKGIEAASSLIPGGRPAPRPAAPGTPHTTTLARATPSFPFPAAATVQPPLPPPAMPIIVKF